MQHPLRLSSQLNDSYAQEAKDTQHIRGLGSYRIKTPSEAYILSPKS